MSSSTARKSRIFTCPACGATFRYADARIHWQKCPGQPVGRKERGE